MTEPRNYETEPTTPNELTPEPPAEAPARRQVGQRTTIHLDGVEPFDVLITNRERIHYEKTQQRRKWPAAAEAQNLAMTFVTWSAAKRAGLTELSYEQWEDALLDYDVVTEVSADPTR